MIKKYSSYKYTHPSNSGFNLDYSTSKFYLRSSVLRGGIIAELFGIGTSNNGSYIGQIGFPLQTGERASGFVYAGGSLLAELPNGKVISSANQNEPFNAIGWRIEDPITGVRYVSSSYSFKVTEPDELGLDVGDTDPFINTDPNPEYLAAIDDTEGWNPTDPTFYLNGFKIKTERAIFELRDPNNRAAFVDPVHTPVEALAQMRVSGRFEKVYDGLEYPDISHGEDEDGVLRIVTDAVEIYHNEFVSDGGLSDDYSSSTKAKKKDELPPQIDWKTCIIEIRGKEIGLTKGISPVAGIHTFALVYTPGNEGYKTYFGAGDMDGELGSRYGVYSQEIAGTDFTDPHKWTYSWETASPCSAVNVGIQVVSDKLNRSHVPYRTWPNVTKEETLNSNSFIYTSLQYIYDPVTFAELDTEIKEKWNYSTPGWGNLLPLQLPLRR